MPLLYLPRFVGVSGTCSRCKRGVGEVWVRCERSVGKVFERRVRLFFLASEVEVSLCRVVCSVVFSVVHSHVHLFYGGVLLEGVFCTI